MAAEKVFAGASLRLTFVAGSDNDGKPILRRTSYQNVKDGAEPDDLLAFAYVINGLTNDPLSDIQLQENNSILEF